MLRRQGQMDLNPEKNSQLKAQKDHLQKMGTALKVYQH